MVPLQKLFSYQISFVSYPTLNSCVTEHIVAIRTSLRVIVSMTVRSSGGMFWCNILMTNSWLFTESHTFRVCGRLIARDIHYISLSYRKEKQHCRAEIVESGNVNMGQSPLGKSNMEHCRNSYFLLILGHQFPFTSQQLSSLAMSYFGKLDDHRLS